MKNVFMFAVFFVMSFGELAAGPKKSTVANGADQQILMELWKQLPLQIDVDALVLGPGRVTLEKDGRVVPRLEDQKNAARVEFGSWWVKGTELVLQLTVFNGFSCELPNTPCALYSHKAIVIPAAISRGSVSFEGASIVNKASRSSQNF